jgi:hypothetical protein
MHFVYWFTPTVTPLLLLNIVNDILYDEYLIDVCSVRFTNTC